MNRARRKNLNSVNAASLARWIVLTLFFAVTGLIYVYLSIQLHRLGDQQNRLEKELTGLRNQNEVAASQITALTSRVALQRRLKEGYLKMIPIAEQNIVRLTPRNDEEVSAIDLDRPRFAQSGEEDAFQPILNNEVRP